MATDWSQFTPVDSAQPGAVDWSQFEPVDGAATKPIDGAPTKPGFFAGAWKAAAGVPHALANVGIDAIDVANKIVGGAAQDVLDNTTRIYAAAGITPTGNAKTLADVKSPIQFHDALNNWLTDTRDTANDTYTPDPNTTGTLGNVGFGAADFVTRMGLGVLTGAPEAVIGLPAVTAGREHSIDLMKQGVDKRTATVAGVADAGIIATLGLVPGGAGAKGLVAKMLRDGGINVGLGVAGRGADKAILKDGGYDALAASSPDVLDPEAIATDFGAGAAFPVAHKALDVITGKPTGASGKPAPKPAPAADEPGVAMADALRTAGLGESVDAALNQGEIAPPAPVPEAPVVAPEAPPPAAEAPLPDAPLPELPAPQNQADPEAIPVERVSPQDMRLSKDVPQFKDGANETGEVEPLHGDYDERGTGPIQLWRRSDGTLEVISGRHRWQHGLRTGKESLPAQIYNEANGYNADWARALDAELNIRDGQGKVADYVQYFQRPGFEGDAGRTEAEQRGLLARNIGKRAFAIARQGSDETIAAHRAGRLTDEAATRIAQSAPGDAQLQLLGMDEINRGSTITHAVNTMRAVGTLRSEHAQSQGGLFGDQDAAVVDGRAMARVASKHQREVGERLSAISGAAKRPELARKEGIDVHDPEAVKQRIGELKAEREAWEKWATDPAMVARVREEAGIPERAAGEVAQGEHSAESVSDGEHSTENDLGDENILPMFARRKGAAFSGKPDTFYSALTDSLNRAKGAPRKGTAEQWTQWLDGAQRRGEFKGAEREWAGLDNWVASQKEPIAREAITDYVRQHQVRLEETMLRDEIPQDEATTLVDNDNGGQSVADADGGVAGSAKFKGYTLPGGKNYRELLLRKPGDTMPAGYRVEKRANGFHVITGLGSDLGRWPTRERAERSQARHPDSQGFNSPHFDQSNVLAHVRMNDRTGPDGEKVLHVEEVQSDWHQGGRRAGYGTPEATAKAHAARISELETRLQGYRDAKAAATSSGDAARATAHDVGVRNTETQLRMARAARGAHVGVPDAPFKKEWPMLAMKRVLRYAAEHGYDRVTWTTGEQQAERYDLSHQVDAVSVSRTDKGGFAWKAVKDGEVMMSQRAPDAAELAKSIGKDIADKADQLKPGEAHDYTGKDLKVGGNGMRAFYDKMLPNEIGKYVKKWGAKVGETAIETRPARELRNEMDLSELGQRAPKDNSTRTEPAQRAMVHSVDITPAMRESVMEGQPMFASRKGAADGDLFAKPATAPAEHAKTAPLAGDNTGDMFGGPSSRDHLGAAERAKDASRNGKTGGHADAGDGGLFDGERPEQASVPDGSPDKLGERATEQSIQNARRGDILRDEAGNEFAAHDARGQRLTAHPVVNGRAQVNADSAVLFHVSDSKRDAYPERDHRALFHTGRNVNDAQPSAPDKMGATNRSATHEQENTSGIPDGLPGLHTAASTRLGIKLTKWFRSRGKPGTFQFREIASSSLPEPAARALRAMEDATGRKIAIVRNLTPELDRFNGVSFKGDKTIYVDAAAEHPFVTIAGHEFGHGLEEAHPDLYRAVADEIAGQGRVADYEAAMRKRGYKGGREQAVSELTNDAIGDALTDPEFLQHMAERNPSAFRELARRFIDFLNTMLGKINDSGSSRYLRDVEAFRDKLADVLDEFAKRGEGAKAKETGWVKAAFQRVFHGTQHTVDRFRLQHIGTGEGAQAYGWGMYFASRRGVAEHYRNALSTGHAVKKSGKLYQTDVPEDSGLLDWDKPLSEQPEGVQAALATLRLTPEAAPKMTGKDAYAILSMRNNGDHQAASEALDAAGIPGLRYLDGTARPNNVIEKQLLRAYEKHNGDVDAALAYQMRTYRGTPKEKADAAKYYRSKLKGYDKRHNYVIWKEDAIGKPQDADAAPEFARRDDPRGPNAHIVDNLPIEHDGKPESFGGDDVEMPARAPGESREDWMTRTLRDVQKTMVDGVREAIGFPKLTPKELEQRVIHRGAWREMLATRQRLQEKAQVAFAGATKLFSQVIAKDKQHNFDMIDGFETHQPVTDKAYKLFFDVMGKELDARWQRIVAIKPGLADDLVRDYFPHMFKDPTKAGKWYQKEMAKRPLVGDTGYMKRRKYPTLKEAMASGLEPISANPVDFALARIMQMDRFLSMHKYREEIKSYGWLKDMPAGARAPLGYARVDDPLFLKAGGLQGYYAVPEQIANDISQSLKVGLVGNSIYRFYRTVQNMMISARLGWSGFHAGFTTFDGMVTHLDRSLRSVAITHDWNTAVTSLLKMPTSILTSPFEGGRYNKMWTGQKLKHWGAAQKAIDAFGLGKNDIHVMALLAALEQGGARMKMHASDNFNHVSQIMRTIREHDVKNSAKNLAPAITELGSWLIHQKLVPAQKMTARVMLMKQALDEFAYRNPQLGKNMGDYAGILDAMSPTAVREIAGKVVKTIDMRLGQMNYDNMFMPKVTKQLGQGVFQAFGWQIGTIGTVTGAVRDIRRNITPEKLTGPLDKAGKINDADFGRFTGNQSYFLAMAALSMAMATTLSYMLTGEGPKKLKDLFFIRTGAKNPDGSDAYIQPPNYWMDHYKIAQHPITTFTHKISPVFGVMAELADNQDYFGVQIRDPHNSKEGQAREVLQYLGKQMLPFSVTNADRVTQSGGGPGRLAASLVGFNPAPASVSRTSFQDFVSHNGNKGYGHELMTKEQAAHSKVVHEMTTKMRNGEKPDLSALTPKDRRRVMKESRVEVPELQFLRMSLQDKLDGWDKASPEERKAYHLRQIIQRTHPFKSDSFLRLPEDERDAITKKIRNILSQK